MQHTKSSRSLVISVLVALAAAICLPLLAGREPVDEQPVEVPAGEVGSGLPLHLYLPLADVPVVSGGGR
jgi:hypothetical protein